MLNVDSIYVQVYRDRIAVKNIATGESTEVMRDMTYASPRMLIADFTTAQHQIKEAIKTVKRGLRAPEVLLHPMELIEGGITQVEYRVFVELGLGAGASKAAVYSGAPLPDESIKKAIREYKH
ncbi:hypothetical protein BurJ1DRAFT_1877 [Burkholderiales bacterium JOSHI_001]|nr:hypothetical protein BurJ1DRAFT_1857 [Burkholderiales bacterium JOSHI_001]EHR70730.1 hypothetical protein BurJ1DRAFT_1877 [Burkholderiales bacterium JOSHI_001]